MKDWSCFSIVGKELCLKYPVGPALNVEQKGQLYSKFPDIP
jgi:hypothetical protein